ARSLLLRQRHARFHRKDIDQVERLVARAALESATKRFAVDPHHPCEIEPNGLGKRRHKAPECGLEGLRAEPEEHTRESIVNWNPMLQGQKQPKQVFLGLSELRHVRAGLCSAQHRGQGDNQYLQQIVSCVPCTGVCQSPKRLLELAHTTPFALWESFPESILPHKAIEAANPYAIPLPASGRGEGDSRRQESGGCACPARG